MWYGRLMTRQELESTYEWASEDCNWIDLDNKPKGDGWRLLQVVPLLKGRYQLIWARDFGAES